MNWEAIGAISEAFGVIVILVSLAYLAVQVRQSTREVSRGVEATQLAAFERNIESGNRIRELLLLHPDLADLMLRGYSSFTELSKTEKFRFSLLMRNIFSSIQGAYIRQLSVEHDPQGVLGTVRVVDELLQYQGVQQWLERNEPDWRPEFQELVNQRVEAIKLEK